MSYETYPYPTLPNPRLDFNGETVPAMKRTQMETGRYRQQRRFTSQLNTYRASWQMSDYQWGLFQAFVLHKLSGGADWFYVNLPTGGEAMDKTVLARIVDGKYAGAHDGVLYWNVSAVLEVEDAQLWTEEEYDALLIAGDILSLEESVDRLDAYVDT